MILFTHLYRVTLNIKKILLFTKKHSTSTWKCRKKSFTLVKKFNSKIGDKHYLNEKFFFLSNSKWTGIKWYFYIDNVTLRREKENSIIIMTLVFFFLQKSKNRNRKKNRLQFALWWWLWALWWQTILLLILIYLHIFRTRICVSNDPEHFFCYIHQVSEVSDKVRTNVKQKIWPIWHWCERMMDIDYHWCVRLLCRFFFLEIFHSGK